VLQRVPEISENFTAWKAGHPEINLVYRCEIMTTFCLSVCSLAPGLKVKQTVDKMATVADSLSEGGRDINSSSSKKKVKAMYSILWETHLRATGRHLPYEITKCYLPPDASERALPEAGTRFTYPRGMEGWVDPGSLIAARLGIEPTTARSTP